MIHQHQKTDEIKPIITLNGNENINLFEGTAYTDEGATVVDPRNIFYTGVVSTAVRGPSGQTSFDSAVVGDWTFTYSAPADASGNVPDSVTRVVTVIARQTFPNTIFSANFALNNIVNVGDGIEGHSLPDHNALTNNDGFAHNTFTLGGVTYTVSDFSYEDGGTNLFFELKEGSNNVDERVVFADYSLVIVDGDGEVFFEEIVDFSDSPGGDCGWQKI